MDVKTNVVCKIRSKDVFGKFPYNCIIECYLPMGVTNIVVQNMSSERDRNHGRLQESLSPKCEARVVVRGLRSPVNSPEYDA
jgi:hypothetical protein